MDAPFNTAIPHPDAEVNLRAAGYTPLPPFAIIDEHEHVRSDGRGVEVFDRPRLERLASKLNHKAKYRNSPLPAVVGHTRPGQGETNQPGIAGYVTRYQVAPFEQDPLTGKVRHAIWGVPWAPPNGGAETFRRFPHRSIELWTGGEGGDDIHPLALLGSTAPRRDLGVHMFSRVAGGGHVAANGQYHYAREVDDMPNDSNPYLPAGGQFGQPQQTGAAGNVRVADMTIDQLANALPPMLAKSKEFAPLFQMSDELTGLLQGDGSGFEGNPGMGGMPGSPGMPGATPEMTGMSQFGGQGGGYPQQPQQFQRPTLFGPPQQQQQQAFDPWAPQPYQAQPLAPQQPTQYQRFDQPQLPQAVVQQVPIAQVPAAGPGDSYHAHFQRLEQIVAAQGHQMTNLLAQLVPQVTQYQRDKEEADIDAALSHLVGVERVQLDPAAEKKHLLTLTVPQRVEHFARMRASYRRLEALPGQPQLGGYGTGGASGMGPGLYQAQYAQPQQQQQPSTGFVVPTQYQQPMPQPAPMHGHVLTVGALQPGQANMQQFARGGVPSEPAVDEAQVGGMDAFTIAAGAQAAKLPVAEYLQRLRTPSANGQPLTPVR